MGNNQSVTVSFLDVETTGLDHQKDKVTEVGIVVVKYTGNNDGVVLESYGSLNDPKMDIPEKVQQITGIDNELVKGRTYDHVYIRRLLEQSEYIIAHNAYFDMGMFIKDIAGRYTKGENLDFVNPKKWLCSKKLVDWSKRIACNASASLNYIAADLGKINPFAHRALYDAALLASIVTNDILNEMIHKGKCRWAHIKALATPFETKDKLKNSGYMPKYVSGEFKYWYIDVLEDGSNIEDQTEFLKKEIYSQSLYRDEKYFPAKIIYKNHWYELEGPDLWKEYFGDKQ